MEKYRRPRDMLRDLGPDRKALDGEIVDFTGIDSPYEEPPDPETVVETDLQDAEQVCDYLIRQLTKAKIIRGGI